VRATALTPGGCVDAGVDVGIGAGNGLVLLFDAALQS